jgi:hypothetical protein
MTAVTLERVLAQARQLPLAEQARLTMLLDHEESELLPVKSLLSWSEIAAEVAERRGER